MTTREEAIEHMEKYLRPYLSPEEWALFLHQFITRPSASSPHTGIPDTCDIFGLLATQEPEEILHCAFCWRDTIQGHYFWKNIRDRLEDHESRPQFRHTDILPTSDLLTLLEEIIQ